MSNIFEPHGLASLFPEELAELVRDIKERGQLEPIILTKASSWTVVIAIGPAE
jgi:ParB-like chromosome segregation protein Spo0J